MLGDYGEVYLVDWGIAIRLDDPASQGGGSGLTGTPSYMAPEMVECGPLGEFTDVYLLGATLHEVLTGAGPHVGATLKDVLWSAYESAPRTYTDDVPAELAEICRRAMARDSNMRVQSVAEFRMLLSGYLTHRGSIALAESALRRLDQFRALFDSLSDSSPSADVRRCYQLVTEARFGLTRALRDWPDNDEARAGLDRCLQSAIELELREGHTSAAVALLAEVTDPPADLVLQVDAATQADRTRAVEERRLRKLDRDTDASVASGVRARWMIAYSVFAIVLSLYLWFGRGEALRPISLVWFGGLVLLTELSVFVIGRQLLDNVFNRRLVLMLVFGTVVMLVNRITGAVTARPVSQTFTFDLLLWTAVSGVTAITMVRPLWIVALLLGSGFVGCVLWPEESMVLFGVSVMLAMPLGGAALWWQRQLDARRRSTEPS